MKRGVCVCVPARDEAVHIPILIDALAEQDLPSPVLVALCVNNSSDGTAKVARAAVARSGGRVTMKLIEVDFAPALAHAGSARRAAMDLGARWLSADDALLISTDADCRPPADWVRANLDAAGAGAIVGGRIELDGAADVSPQIARMRRRFDAYWQRVRAIEDAIDPVPWDPPPRHGDHTGASLALSVGLYVRAGGVPVIPTGEDRALVEAGVKAGGRLVHPQSVWTRASCRTAGRAAGGMATDMQRWLGEENPLVPGFAHWQERARWRRERRLAEDVDMIEAERRLPTMPCDMTLPMASFG